MQGGVEGAVRLGDGDYHHRIPVRGEDGVGDKGAGVVEGDDGLMTLVQYGHAAPVMLLTGGDGEPAVGIYPGGEHTAVGCGVDIGLMGLAEQIQAVAACLIDHAVVVRGGQHGFFHAYHMAGQLLAAEGVVLSTCGGSKEVAVLQPGDVQPLAAAVGEWLGLVGLTRLQGTVGKPAPKGVQIQLVPKDHKGQRTQHHSGGKDKGQNAQQHIPFFGCGVHGLLITHMYAPAFVSITSKYVLVVPQFGHVKTARGYGGACQSAVARVQNGRDVLRGQLALGGVDHGAYHGPDHFV